MTTFEIVLLIVFASIWGCLGLALAINSFYDLIVSVNREKREQEREKRLIEEHEKYMGRTN